MTALPPQPPPDDVLNSPSDKATPATRKRDRLSLFAAVASVLALLVAGAALVVALQAPERANSARDTSSVDDDAAPGRASESSGGDRPGESTPDDGSEPTATPEIPELNERTQYEVAYDKEELRLQADCDGTTYVDFDEPRVGVDRDVADLAFTRDDCLAQPGPGYFTLIGGAVGATDTTPALTPNDCAQRIRTGPLSDEAEVPVRQGVVLCLITSAEDARARGISQKVVLLEVRGVSADVTATIQVTAWHIPR